MSKSSVVPKCTFARQKGRKRDNDREERSVPRFFPLLISLSFAVGQAPK